MTALLKVRVAAVTGFLAVAFGAFGAHGLKDVLLSHETTEIWKTASLYHLAHAVLLFAVSSSAKYNRAWWCFLAGICVFSGSLYILAVTGFTKLGTITPLGGLALLAGWLLLAINAGQKDAGSD